MLHDGQPIGVISVTRSEPGVYSPEEVELLRTFVDQAVIAIENVRLFTELDMRNRELRVALEQQTATSELLKVIGQSTFDLQPVFETLAENAVKLCEAERAIINRFDGQLLQTVAGYELSAELRAFHEQNPTRIERGSGAGARPSSGAPYTFTMPRRTPNTPTTDRWAYPVGPCWPFPCCGRMSC